MSTDKQTDKQTDRQTDKLTNATKNITSFAKEVINDRVLENEAEPFWLDMNSNPGSLYSKTNTKSMLCACMARYCG